MNLAARDIETDPREFAMCQAFLSWQCRVRQMAMRKNEGRPDKAITPSLTLAGAAQPVGKIVTVLNKNPAYSVTPEMKHMARQTHDPAQRREKAIQFFSATYYQKAREFAGTLTSTFTPGSETAEAICKAGTCTLDIQAYGQQFSIVCVCSRLAGDDPLYQATWWHNVLFNPNLSSDTVVLGFEPDWGSSSAVPDISENHVGR